jgi:hypothetical protein
MDITEQAPTVNSHISYSLIKNYFKNNFNFVNSPIVFQKGEKTFFQFKIRGISGTNCLYNIEIQKDKNFVQMVDYINDDIIEKFPDLILKYS